MSHFCYFLATLVKRYARGAGGCRWTGGNIRTAGHGGGGQLDGSCGRAVSSIQGQTRCWGLTMPRTSQRMTKVFMVGRLNC